MKVVKKINNNVAICIDNNNKELIAFGKGIGYPTIPYELTNLSVITRTYYDVNSSYVSLLENIPENIFEISAKITDYAKRRLSSQLNSNIVFTLADHIHFSIQRLERNIDIKFPFMYDIEHLHDTEMEIGKKSVIFINKALNIRLPSGEAAGIALHFINAENMQISANMIVNEKKIINKITCIVEKKYKLK